MPADPVTIAPPVDPLAELSAGCDRFLALAGTWLAWDGRPYVAEGGGRIFTPHKAVRRQADHLLDHLTEVTALVAGFEPPPNNWQESRVTTAADWARFTEADLREATERLTRLVLVFQVQLRQVESAWDLPREGHWTLREIALHVADPWYAEQVGDLGATG